MSEFDAAIFNNLSIAARDGVYSHEVTSWQNRTDPAAALQNTWPTYFPALQLN
jgi:hypothetical protein